MLMRRKMYAEEKEEMADLYMGVLPRKFCPAT